MREISQDLGKVYEKDGYYFLEKIYSNMQDLMKADPILKKDAKKRGFKVKDYTWSIEDNPYYSIQKIINDGYDAYVDQNRYILTLKLEF
tara:strand:- start:3576 stop:3842 length:267 start_codon:yes stop_codon:yes gene_type:complete